MARMAVNRLGHTGSVTLKILHHIPDLERVAVNNLIPVADSAHPLSKASFSNDCSSNECLGNYSLSNDFLSNDSLSNYSLINGNVCGREGIHAGCEYLTIGEQIIRVINECNAYTCRGAACERTPFTPLTPSSSVTATILQEHTSA